MHDMQGINERLAWLRKRRYRTASDAARAIGVPEATYLGHENGSRGLRPATAVRYAKFYRASVDWLLTGKGDPDDANVSSVQVVPRLSWVPAGDWWLPEQIMPEDDLPSIEATGLPNGDWVALEVSGSSMDRISPPGSIIFVNRAERVLAPNACYVIADEEGRTTYKRYRPSPERFEPVTFTDGHETLFPDGKIKVIGRVRRSTIDM
ncbi:helix-turn-helix domain-containing protein [Xanthobacter sp. DSM 14520]|uniref:LexA family transcriptional regulator n=1 Tax=Xanthobacter autotrophicus (strain ATCC BAA-1158 / Py2) TaxID=78245 RepID=UPI00372C2497